MTRGAWLRHGTGPAALGSLVSLGAQAAMALFLLGLFEPQAVGAQLQRRDIDRDPTRMQPGSLPRGQQGGSDRSVPHAAGEGLPVGAIRRCAAGGGVVGNVKSAARITEIRIAAAGDDLADGVLQRLRQAAHFRDVAGAGCLDVADGAWFW